MKTITLLFALTLTAACSSIPPPVANTVKDCSAEAAAGLLGKVNSAIATGDWQGELEALAVDAGLCAVNKAVAQLLESAGKRAQYDELEALKQARAKRWLAEHQTGGEQTMQQALHNSSARVSNLDLVLIAEAMNAQGVEVARAWDLPPQPVVFYDRTDRLPVDMVRILDVVDRIDVPGAIGYHTNEAGVIYGRIASGDGVNVTATHEGAEMAVDPACAAWRPMPDGFAVALEVCDPVQGDAYPIDVELGRLGIQRTIMASNWVYPAWFTDGAPGPYDRMGLCTRPFEVRPGGYIIVRDASGHQGERFARSAPFVRFGEDDRGRLAFATRMANPDGRTARRLRA